MKEGREEGRTEGREGMLFILVKYLIYMCYIYKLVDGDLLNSVFLIYGGGHRGYGKVNLPKVNITEYLAHDGS